MNYTSNGPLKEIIEMQEISTIEASNFKENFYNKFLAVIEIEKSDQNQIFYIFPVDYELYNNYKAIEFYNKKKYKIFDEFYNEFLYFFNNFPDYHRKELKYFFKETFISLTERD
ncbi:hypothetical protein GVAV_000010 [Gurleya vavrai]